MQLRRDFLKEVFERGRPKGAFRPGGAVRAHLAH